MADLTDPIGRRLGYRNRRPGYAAYARIFHPPDDGPHPSRWAQVAARHGREMHPSVQWEHISSAVAPVVANDRGRAFPGEPDIGTLNLNALTALCAIVREHTATPQDCWFAVWEGWGWLHPESSITLRFTRDGHPPVPTRHLPDSLRLDASAPTFSLPHRNYLLFNGPVEDATYIGDWTTSGRLDPQSPSIFWPTDHAWCVATEIDFDTTLVGGSRELIAAIIGSDDLEALPIAPDVPYEDLISI